MLFYRSFTTRMISIMMTVNHASFSFKTTYSLNIVLKTKSRCSWFHESWRSGHLPSELPPWWRCFLWLGPRAVATFSADARLDVLRVQDTKSDIHKKPSCLLCFGLSDRAELAGVKCVCDRNIYLGVSCLFTVALGLASRKGGGGARD